MSVSDMIQAAIGLVALIGLVISLANVSQQRDTDRRMDKLTSAVVESAAAAKEAAAHAKRSADAAEEAASHSARQASEAERANDHEADRTREERARVDRRVLEIRQTVRGFEVSNRGDQTVRAIKLHPPAGVTCPDEPLDVAPKGTSPVVIHGLTRGARTISASWDVQTEPYPLPVRWLPRVHRIY